MFEEVGNMASDRPESEGGKNKAEEVLLASPEVTDSVLIQSGVVAGFHREVEKSTEGVNADEYKNGNVLFIRLGLMSVKSKSVELDKSNPEMSVEDSSGQELLSMGCRSSPYPAVNMGLGGTV